MYRTKSLGIIYDQYLQSYRPVYQVIKNELLSQNQENQFQSNRTYKSNKQKFGNQNKIKASDQKKVIMKPQQIDARVKSPQPRLYHKSSLRNLNKNITLVSPKSKSKLWQTNLESKVKINKFNYAPTYASSDWNSSENRRQQSVNKDSIQSPQYVSNYQIFGLLHQLKAIINNKYTSKQSISELNHDIIYLSSIVSNQNCALSKLQQQLMRSQLQLTKSRQVIINNNSNYGHHLDYGKQARSKLRYEIDNLKQSYEILLDRIQNQFSNPFLKQQQIKYHNLQDKQNSDQQKQGMKM